MKNFLFSLILAIPHILGAQCACACYDANDLDNCTSGSCSQANFMGCINAGLTWYQGAGSVPNGMCACEYLVLISLAVELEELWMDCDSVYWKTSFENNCDQFIVEGSDDGTTWTRASILNCNNVQSGGHYSYMLGNNSFKYYRVSELDFDGKLDFLGVVSDNCNTGATNVVGVYDAAGRFLGTKIPVGSGFYLIRYSNGETIRIYQGE
jgi:hypothetical protein